MCGLKYIFFIFFIFFVSLSGCQVYAEETYWLESIVAPIKPPSTVYPYLENPTDRTGDVAALTIAGGKILFNGEWCAYEVEKVKPFKIDRLLADLIEDMGGRKEFDNFLSKRLRTSMVDWKKEYFLIQSNVQIDEAPCRLLQGSSIYQGNKELVLWDTTFFYRFKLGEKFKY